MKIINHKAMEKGHSFSVALIVGQYNQRITDELKQGALQRLQQVGIRDQDILIIDVPGAVEIPLIAKRLAMQNKIEVIIALGAVVRGETSHYDYVCEQVSSGCQQVALEYNLPVIFGVLTTENEAQAWDRLGGHHGHKGIEAADCAIAMYSILGQL